MCLKRLSRLWARVGVVDTTQYYILQSIFWRNKVITDVCPVLLAIHTLTECERTNKFGAKVVSLKEDNVMDYLGNFWKLEADMEEVYLSRLK